MKQVRRGYCKLRVGFMREKDWELIRRQESGKKERKKERRKEGKKERKKQGNKETGSHL